MTTPDPRRADSTQADPVPPGPGRGELERIAAGQHHDPHSVLGAHPGKDGVVIRALRPMADSVAVVLEDGRRLPMEHVHEGVFAVSVPDEKVPGYRIAATYPGSTAEEVRDDPYRHLPTLGEFDLYLIGEGRHEELWRVLGAHVREFGTVSGTSFAVWAPNAHGVRVTGDFSGWDGRAYPMRSLGGSGVWELFIPGIGEGTRYKYAVCGPDGVWREKADPMADSAEQPPATASVVYTSRYTLGRPGVDDHARRERAGARADEHLRGAPQVHLVDAHRLAHRLALGPRVNPPGVAPGVPGGVDHRRGGGRHLGRVGHRVGLLRHTPSGPQIAYLYRVPSPMPGTNSSHTPDPPSERIGYARPSQPLKSPVTRTPCALGAQTANDAPVVWPISRTCPPSTRHSSSCRPSPIRYRSNSPSVGRCRYGSSRTSSPEPEPEPEPEVSRGDPVAGHLLVRHGDGEEPRYTCSMGSLRPSSRTRSPTSPAGGAHG